MRNENDEEVKRLNWFYWLDWLGWLKGKKSKRLKVKREKYIKINETWGSHRPNPECPRFTILYSEA
jgi:hypothetical protein